jgi:hypothetical protein
MYHTSPVIKTLKSDAVGDPVNRRSDGGEKLPRIEDQRLSVRMHCEVTSCRDVSSSLSNFDEDNRFSKWRSRTFAKECYSGD